ncbi:MAG: undecaprenyl-diphosphate phosphatase [Planctomycetota bacterium]|jgi:undecaprenyl-diphosphatase
MALLTIIVLAVLQGLTEFLPVSSSGHLVLAQTICGMEDPDQNLAVVVFLHLGSLLAILVYFFRDLLKLFTGRRRELAYLILGSVPAAAVGFAFGGDIKALFGAPLIVCAALVANGVFLWIAEMRAGSPGELNRWWKALAIGCAQVAGMVPGISRSGTTIGTALLLRTRADVAVRFSFFLGAIAVFGAGLYEARKAFGGQADLAALPIVIGVTVSFAVSLAAIRLVALLAERRKLRWFGIYCAGLGLAGLVYFLLAS